LEFNLPGHEQIEDEDSARLENKAIRNFKLPWGSDSLKKTNRRREVTRPEQSLSEPSEEGSARSMQSQVTLPSPSI